jgi:hypothetical protein
MNSVYLSWLCDKQYELKFVLSTSILLTLVEVRSNELMLKHMVQFHDLQIIPIRTFTPECIRKEPKILHTLPRQEYAFKLCKADLETVQ